LQLRLIELIILYFLTYRCRYTDTTKIRNAAANVSIHSIIIEMFRVALKLFISLTSRYVAWLLGVGDINKTD